MEPTLDEVEGYLDLLDVVVRGLALAGAIALCAPIAHKVRLVASRSERDDPLVRVRPWLARHPRAWLSIAAAVEAGVSALLVALPAAGCLALAALCALYTSQLAHLSPSDSCACFGAAAPMRRAAALRRNVVFVVLGALAGAGYLAGAVQRADIGEATGVAAVLLAPVVATAFLNKSGYRLWPAELVLPRRRAG